MSVRSTTQAMLVSGSTILPLRAALRGILDPPALYEVAPERLAPLDLDAAEFRYRIVGGIPYPVREASELAGSRRCANLRGRAAHRDAHSRRARIS